jgi:hypothetical protein
MVACTSGYEGLPRPQDEWFVFVDWDDVWPLNERDVLVGWDSDDGDDADWSLGYPGM